MSFYNYLNIPKSCGVGSPIFKKTFYEIADLSTSDKKLFANNIKKITWQYSLKEENTNIKPYKDDLIDYPEIEIIEVELLSDTRLNRIAEIIMRAIPYPMLLIFKMQEKFKLYLAHQKISLSDSSKNTLEELIYTDWLDIDSHILKKLNIKEMRFTNFYDLYSDLVDAISIYQASAILPSTKNISGEEARNIITKIECIDQEIAAVRSKFKKETQFNRRIELNIQIKKLEQEKEDMIGEFEK